MRKLTFGMNVSLDGYIAAPGDRRVGRQASVNLSLVETRTFPDAVVLTRYETRR